MKEIYKFEKKTKTKKITKKKKKQKKKKKKKSVKMDLEAISYRTPQLCNLVSTKIKDLRLYQHSKKNKIMVLW